MRKRVWTLLPWLLAGALFVWAARAVPLAETWTALRGLTPAEVGWLAALNVAALLLLNGRWWALLRGLGHSVPFLTLAMHRLAAFGVSYFTPGPHFGGEPAQVLLVERRHGVPRATAVTAVTLDKSLELLINFAFLTAGVLVVLENRLLRGLDGDGAVILAVTLLALPVGLLGLIWRGKRPFSRPLGLLLRWRRLAVRPEWRQQVVRLHRGAQQSERQAERLFRESPDALWLALLFSVLSWLAMLLEFGLLVFFLGIALSPLQIVALLVAARVAILLPLPAGVGTLEASQVLALNAMGFNGAVGLGVSLIIRARDVGLGLVGLWWGARQLTMTPAKLTATSYRTAVDRVTTDTHLLQEEEHF